MSNEQLRTIAVNQPARVVSGRHAGKEGTVLSADWNDKAIWIMVGVQPIYCAWHEVEQDGSQPAGGAGMSEHQPYGEGGECTCIRCGITSSRTWVCERCQKVRDSKTVAPAPQQPMTAEQMAEILQAVDAATPGPWYAASYTGTSGLNSWHVSTSPGTYGACITGWGRVLQNAEDAHLIANAPTWLRSLLAEVQRLTADRDAERVWRKTLQARDSDELSFWAENEHLTAEVQRRQGEIARLDERMRTNHLQALRNATLLDEEKERSARLQAENDQLVKKQKERAYAFDALSKDFLRDQRENVQLRQKIAELTERHENLATKYHDLQDEEHTLTQEVHRLKDKVGRKQVERDQFRQQLGQWEEAARIPDEKCEGNGGYQRRATPDDLREMIARRMEGIDAKEINQLRQEIERCAERAEDCLNSGDYQDHVGAESALRDITVTARRALKGDRSNG